MKKQYAGQPGLYVLCLLVVCMLALVPLVAQSLWEDHNPYNPGVRLVAGTILKLKIDEPIKIEYEYEDLRDENITVKLVPDQNLTEFLKPVDANQNVTSKNKGKLKSNNRVVFSIGVRVLEVSEQGTIQFSGSKQITAESGKHTQQISVRGQIHRDDIKVGRMILSGNVADLVINVRGAPIKQNKNITMKVEGNPAQPKANLSETEKQRLLLDYLNRVLGETDNK